MADVVFSNVSKVYPDGTRAVDELDLEIADGELMVFVGPSGCGKTTALRMVGGLEDISDGEIRISGRRVNDLDPQQRDIAMVFQNYALYPHMSVFDNIAFPLRAQGVKRDERKRRVEEVARLLELSEQLKRRPRNLSGGQRQRVAMGRALIRQPQVFLMDEPLSNLDAKLRVEMRAEIAALQQKLGVTTIYVTHDQVEAMTMGKTIAVMRKGVLQQWGEPYSLYDRPANLFVAEFIGSPPMNLFQATLEVGDGAPLLALVDQQLRLPPGFLDSRPALAAQVGAKLAVGIRPEYLQDARVADRRHPTVRAQVRLVETLGPERQVHLDLAAQPVLTPEVLEVARDVDAAIAESIVERTDTRVVRAIARFEPDSQVAAGAVQELAVVPEKLRFFDLETGAALWER
jgi:multiple sugar transport system ATP-binding protein